MKPRYFSIIGALAVMTAGGPLLLPAAAQAPSSTEVEATEDNQAVEVLTRGPVHEAFAEAVMSNPEPGLIISKAPPTPIEELPPEQELEGDNVTWISGYWAWDDDQNDFLWISGVWRNIPPGRQWVPGYWNDLGGSQWQWTSGYWADSETMEVDYVEEAPPATLDAGPNVESPGDDYTWIPGNWRYAETRYVWSPGYYTPLRPDWTWVPSRWSWTPRGYCYVDGYWDYAIARRGILFAPVHFHRPVWALPGYHYTPSIVVGLNVFTDHCWVRPRFGHYYFGDYYAPRYSGLGFFSPHVWHGHRAHYDPIWAHVRWHHRHDHGWGDRFRDRFAFLRAHEDARPFRTWAAMRDFRGDRFRNDDIGRTRFFASRLNGFANNPVGGMRFRQINQERRNQLVQQRQQMRDFAQNRRQVEMVRNNRGPQAQGNRMAIAREKLRRSPVVGRNAAQMALNQAPPRRPEARGNRVRPDAVVRGGQGQNGRDLARGGNAAGRNGLAQGQGRNRPNQAVPQTNRNPRDAAANGNRGGQQRQQVRPNVGRNPDAAQRQNPGRAAQQATPQRRQQVNPQQRQVQPQRQQVRPQQQARPQQRQAAPQRQQVRPQQQARPQQRQAAPQRQQVRPQQQARPQQRQAAPQRQQARPQQRQAAPQRQQARPQQRQAAPQRQQARPQQRQAAPQRQQARPQQRQAAPQRQQARPQQRQAAPQRQQARPQQRQAAPQRQQARPQQRQAAPQRQQQRQQGRGKNRADA